METNTKLKVILRKGPESKTYISHTQLCSFFFLMDSEKEILTKGKICIYF